MAEGYPCRHCHAVPVFGIRDLVTAWGLDPVPMAGIALAAVGYVLASRGAVEGRSSRRVRSAAGAPGVRGSGLAFGAGLAVLLVAIVGPPHELSESSFFAHMVQHLLIQLVAAPLLLLGAPITRLLWADPPWLPRQVLARVLRSGAVRVLGSPGVAFSLFALVLLGSHLSSLYELTLEYGWLHQLEHVAYLATALIFWWPAIGMDPGPLRLSQPARALYLLLLMPVMALLGLAIVQADHILYPYYAEHLPPWGASAAADQALAGTLMWVSGMLVMPVALGLVLLRWLDDDERAELRRVRAAPPQLPSRAQGSR